MITLSIAVLTSFFTIFSLLLFLIALVNNNTKINKIRFEKLIEEKIYANLRLFMLFFLSVLFEKEQIKINKKLLFFDQRFYFK